MTTVRRSRSKSNRRHSRSRSRKTSQSRSRSPVKYLYDKSSQESKIREKERLERRQIFQQRQEERDRKEAIKKIEAMLPNDQDTSYSRKAVENDSTNRNNRSFKEEGGKTTVIQKNTNKWDITKPDYSENAAESNDVYVNKMKKNITSIDRTQGNKLPSVMRVDVCNNLKKNVQVNNDSEASIEEKNSRHLKCVKNVDSKPFGFLQGKPTNKENQHNDACKLDQISLPKDSLTSTSGDEQEYSPSKVSSKSSRWDNSIHKSNSNLDLKDGNSRAKSSTSKLELKKESIVTSRKSETKATEPTHVYMGATGLLNFHVLSKQNEGTLKPSPLAAIAQYSSDSSDNDEEEREVRRQKEQSKRFWKYNTQRHPSL